MTASSAAAGCATRASMAPAEAATGAEHELVMGPTELKGKSTHVLDSKQFLRVRAAGEDHGHAPRPP